VAIITSVGRGYIQFYLLRQIKFEDYIHLLGAGFLIGLTTLYYVTMQSWYKAITIIHNGTAAITQENVQLILTDFAPLAKQQSAMAIMAITILFLIKLAYMGLFYRLISRVKNLYRYWWLVMVFVVRRHLI
jgi:hypothetical protein